MKRPSPGKRGPVQPKPGKNPPAKIAFAKQASTNRSSRNGEVFPVVGVGASAGGLEAFSELLANLPEKTGMAFVLVQHLDPTHGSALEEILSRKTKIPVIEVTNGMAVERNHIYVIPANADIKLDEGVLRLMPRVAARGTHKPIDSFLQSLAHERADQSIAVILSGTASDGTVGCGAVKAAGGITFAQDEATAKYGGMPGNAALSGCIDFVLPPRAIAAELGRIGKNPYIAPPSGRSGRAQEGLSNDELQQLFTLIRNAVGVDFTHYKQSTLQRRIKRRMILNGTEKFTDYLRLIKDKPKEIDGLYRDILIHVTGFFREKGAFEVLRKRVFPKLFEDRMPGSGPVRVWVPGCSTGEEAYSIAIALMEHVWLDRAGPIASTEIQIFATDISDDVLDHARSGIYAESALADVSPERIKRFFARHNGSYQVSKAIREICVFARQNFAKDPPFSNLGLISCRNLLIYLGPELQRRVIPALHYGLKPNGYLMVGGAEGLGTFTDYFTPIDKTYKIYEKKQTAARLITYPTGGDYSLRKAPAGKMPPAAPSPGFTSIEKEADRVLLDRFVQASIVVNSDLEIVHFRGKTGAYLEPAAGRPTFSLSKMVREGLLVDLHTALQEAQKKNLPVRREGVSLPSNGSTRKVNLDVIPIPGQSPRERFYAVVFQEAPQDRSTGPAGKPRGARAAAKESSQAQENERLTREVRQLKDRLRALIEDQESTAEEYKSANEEVLSANEELQSTNEELETAKEELQSSNEELTTLNEEMQNRNTELSVTNNDLLNLLSNVSVAVVMVGNDLRIRRFTPLCETLLNLLPPDIGRRIGEIRSNVSIDNLEEIARQAVQGEALCEIEVQDNHDTWYMMRARPYKTWDGKIEGAVISFQDVDVLKRTLDETKAYADTLIENAREAILILDGELRVVAANRGFYDEFKVTPDETEKELIYGLGNHQWDIPALRELLESVIKKNTRIDDFEVRHNFEQIGEKVMLLNARVVEPRDGKTLIFLSIENVTEEWTQRDAIRRQAALLDLAHDAVIVRDIEGNIQFWNRGAEEMYGWKKEEALAKTTHEILQTVFPKPFEEIKEDLQQTAHWEGELSHTTRNGESKFVRSRWAYMEQASKPPVILEINTDISEQRQYEESLRQLSGHLMRVQDEERRRIARELHDSTGQKLAAARMFLDAVSKTSNTKSDKRISETVELIDAAFQDIRTLSQILHPPLLDEAGLISATRSMVDSFAGRAKIAVEFRVPEDFGRLSQAVELALFRVIQESLTNIHRHSGASEAKIDLAKNGGGVTLEIRDNGKGLRPDLLSRPDGKADGKSNGKQILGVGILGMKERLSQLGGTLKINSGKQGTVVKATLPNDEKQ